jgi:transcription initiation factor IIF auxiliary subunit
MNCINRFCLLLIFAGTCIGSPPAAAATLPRVQADNTAERIGVNRWRWTIYLIAQNQRDLAHVSCVEYTLHPTFPNPVQRVCGTSNPQRPFALTGVGWGTFTVNVRVFFTDGSPAIQFSHQLEFDNKPSR